MKSIIALITLTVSQGIIIGNQFLKLALLNNHDYMEKFR